MSNMQNQRVFEKLFEQSIARLALTRPMSRLEVQAMDMFMRDVVKKNLPSAEENMVELDPNAYDADAGEREEAFYGKDENEE